jgi:type VI secretion system protein
MKQGLFESLTGEFYDGTAISSVPENQRQMLSISDHLTRLFNTRSGSVTHLADYGLPDISELYSKMPDGMNEFRAAIRRTVEKYEPRLKNIRVAPQNSDNKNSQLVFILSAELKTGGQVRFQTTFSTTEPSTIIPWRKPQ